MKTVMPLLAVLFLVFSGCATKNASYFYTQKQLAQGDLDFETRLRVDEYINAFPQENLKRPPAGKDLVGSVDWLQSEIPSGSDTAIAQIAIRTRGPTDAEKKKRFGISLVLDVSGSMLADRKFDDAIAAVNAMVDELDDGTEFALTSFSSEARTVIQPVRLDAASRLTVKAAIAQLRPVGGTDIEAGLLTGWAAMNRMQVGTTPRIVLITDGRSNVGFTTPEDFVRKAGARYHPVRISTVGLGHDVDEPLLRSIAEKSQGHYYFADTGANLTRILRDELRTLMTPVAKDVTLLLSARPGFEIKRVYGFESLKPAADGTLSIPFGEMNVDDWRVVMTEVRAVKALKGSSEPISVTLRHSTLAGPNAKAAKPQSASVRFDAPSWGAEPKGKKPKINPAVARNAVIFADAMTLIEASRLSKDGKLQEAERVLTVQIANVEIARQWDETKSLDRELNTLLEARRIVREKAGIKNEEIVASAPDAAVADPNARLKSIVKGAVSIAGAVLPGPWSTILSVLSSAILAD